MVTRTIALAVLFVVVLVALVARGQRRTSVATTLGRRRHATLKVFATLVVGWGAGRVAGQSLPSGEQLLFSPPITFKVGYDLGQGNGSITEFVPNGESVEDWSEILTVQVFRRLAVDPATWLQNVGTKYVHDCPRLTHSPIGNGHVNGYSVSMLLIKCPLNPRTGKPETTFFRIIKGNDALYSFQHAWRSIPSDEEIDKAAHAMAKISVCDTRTPEHPCPSLDSIASPK